MELLAKSINSLYKTSIKEEKKKSKDRLRLSRMRLIGKTIE